MPSPGFNGLKFELLKAGVAPVYIERTILELSAHWEDLERDALAAGLSAAEAEQWAHDALGTEQVIAAAVLARPELRDWTQRWPLLTACLRYVAMLAGLPLLPVTLCWQRGAVIARWSLSVALAMVLTSSLFFSLNYLIVFR